MGDEGMGASGTDSEPFFFFFPPICGVDEEKAEMAEEAIGIEPSD